MSRRAFIATPTYRGDVVTEYVTSLMRDFIDCAANGWYIEKPWFKSDTLIHFARHHAIDAFLQSKHEVLVFIDADMGWEEGGLLKLLQTEGDIVGGLYPAKSDKPHWPFQGEVLDQPFYAVDGLPTGFMKVTRRAVHRILADFPKPFSPMYAENGDEWGEDLAFCNRAKQCGLSVVARTDIEFVHIGPFAWKGRFSDFVKAQNNGD